MKCLNVQAIEDIILIDVLDFKKPERAGAHCRGLATKAAERIAQAVHLPADLGRFQQVHQNIDPSVEKIEELKTSGHSDMQIAMYTRGFREANAGLERTKEYLLEVIEQQSFQLESLRGALALTNGT